VTQLVFQRFAEIAGELLGERVGTIVEVGARDCTETLDFRRAFPRARIFAFECNPTTLPACREALRGVERVRLVEKAVSDREGTLRFYPTDPARTITKHAQGNPGASSLFRARSDYPHETYVQNEIEVESTTLERLMREEDIAAIDLLWMDIQGAELMALRGLGERLRDVRLIHLEVEFQPIYEGQPLFPEVHRYLRGRGFRLVGFTSYSRYSADAVYAAREVLRGPLALARLTWRHSYLARLRMRRARHRLKRFLIGR